MSVEITRGRQVVEPKYESMWQIEVNYMHGDANGFSTETCSYTDQNELILHLEGLKFMKSLPLARCQIDDNKEKLEAFMIEQMDASEEEAQDFIEFYHQCDTTDESYDNDAQIKSINVYWYDENGIKFHNSVIVNGSPL